MRLSDRVTAGFDKTTMLCVGLHIHPQQGEVLVDFFGFYFNACVRRLP